MTQRNVERKSDWFVSVYLLACDELPKWKASGKSGISYWHEVFQMLPKGVKISDAASLERRYNNWVAREVKQKQELEKAKAQKKKASVSPGKEQSTNMKRILAPIMEAQLAAAIKALARCNLPLRENVVMYIAQEMAGHKITHQKRWYADFCTRQQLHVRNMKQISYSRTNGVSILPETEFFIENVRSEVASGVYVGRRIMCMCIIFSLDQFFFKFLIIVSLLAKSFIKVDETLLKTKQGNLLYARRTTVSDHPSQFIGERSSTVGSWIPFIDASGDLVFSVLVLKNEGELVTFHNSLKNL